MATTKTATLTFRIEPGLKEVLRTAAEQEHRSIANMVEVMIRDYCERNNIAVSVQNASAMSTNAGKNSVMSIQQSQRASASRKSTK